MRQFFTRGLRSLALLLTMLYWPAGARAQVWEWAAAGVSQPTNSGYTNGYAALATDAAGNTYVTGRFDGTLTLGSFTLVNNGPGVDMYLARLNPAGVFTLAVRVPASILLTPRTLALAPDGTVLVAGGLIGSGDFGGTLQTTSAGGTDIFVARFNPALGAWTQVSRAGGPSNDGVRTLVVAPDGTITITGGCNADCVFGSLPPQPNQGAADVYVAQLSPAGQWLRASTGGGPGFDYGEGLAVGANGDVVVAANMGSATADFGLGSIGLAGGQDVLLARYSPSLGQWTQAVAGGGPDYDEATGVALAPDGTATVVGLMGLSTTYGPFSLTSAGSNDAVVARLDAGGTWIQAQRVGGPGQDLASAVRVEADGTATVGGSFEQTAAFGSLSLTSAGFADVFVARFSAGGSWTQVLAGGGPGNESPTGMALQGSTATLAGSFANSATFGPHTLGGGGFTDTFISRFQSYPDLVVSTLVQLPGGEYNNVTVTGTGTLILTDELIVHGTMTVQTNGTLGSGPNCVVITGPGNFVLEDRAFLGICSPEGITQSGPTGSVQVLGTRSFHIGADYGYSNPFTDQVTGNALPAEVRSITLVHAGRTVTLSQGLAVKELLAAGGNLQLAGQPLTLLSSATGTAVVGNQPGLVIGSTATVQRFINSPYQGMGYRHYSSPVSGMTVGGLATAGFTPEVSQGAAYNASLTPNLIRPFPTVYAYNESRVLNSGIVGFSVFDRGWEAATSLTTPLAVGRGYTVHLPGTARVSFSGPLNHGPVSLTLSRSASPDGGWYLLGNPYPSPLDAGTFTVGSDSLDNLQNLGAAIYTYAATGPYAGTYRASVAGLGGSPVIPTGQAFFVRASAPTGPLPAVLFTDDNRRRFFQAADDTFRRPAADARPQLMLSLRDAAGHADPTIVYFDRPATAAFDPLLDAAKLRNPGGQPNLATVLGPERYAINGLPLPAGQPRTLPLALELPTTGRFTLTLDAALSFGAGDAIYLTDAATGTRQDLRQHPGYAFTAPAGELTSRFALVFGPAGAPLGTAIAAKAALALYPNPAHHSAELRLLPAAGARPVQVLDALGREVHRQLLPAQAGALTLNLCALPAGVYAVRCGAATARLVVE